MATTEKKEMEFANVKAGDRVWLRSDYGRAERGGGLKRVMATSPSFIYLEGGSKAYNTYKRDGYQYGRHLHGKITGVATDAECAEWDAERAREATERKAKESAKKTAEEKRTELQREFASCTTSVHYTNWHSKENVQLYRVEFDGLTEEQVRELAAKLSK